ncbi:MAG: hypothetical protein R8G66_23015 [Cytophagales bacterium]|nr:hypothetical protein [Cytophagales bacterium]
MQILDSLLFNPLTNTFAERAEKIWPLPPRAQSMISDFARGIAILAPFLIALFVLDNYFPISKLDFYAFWPLTVLVFFNKDIVSGRSIAKRKLGFAIVKNNSEEPATQFQCFIRNITSILWPLEALLAFGGAEQRIGDFIAGTKVIEQPPQDNSSFTAELINTKISLQLIIANALVIAAGITAQILF